VHNKQTSRTRKIFIVVWEHSVAVSRPRFLLVMNLGGGSYPILLLRLTVSVRNSI
jgi:hypothetical protein